MNWTLTWEWIVTSYDIDRTLTWEWIVTSYDIDRWD